ncbi:Hunchback -like protein [Trichinella sp. T6]|nr:Hunchback -like protein [Trichinella sp. T6]
MISTRISFSSITKSPDCSTIAVQMSAANISGNLSQYGSCVPPFLMTDKPWNFVPAAGGAAPAPAGNSQLSPGNMAGSFASKTSAAMSPVAPVCSESQESFDPNRVSYGGSLPSFQTMQVGATGRQIWSAQAGSQVMPVGMVASAFSSPVVQQAGSNSSCATSGSLPIFDPTSYYMPATVKNSAGGSAPNDAQGAWLGSKFSLPHDGGTSQPEVGDDEDSTSLANVVKANMSSGTTGVQSTQSSSSPNGSEAAVTIQQQQESAYGATASLLQSKQFQTVQTQQSVSPFNPLNVDVYRSLAPQQNRSSIAHPTLGYSSMLFSPNPAETTTFKSETTSLDGSDEHLLGANSGTTEATRLILKIKSSMLAEHGGDSNAKDEISSEHAPTAVAAMPADTMDVDETTSSVLGSAGKSSIVVAVDSTRRTSNDSTTSASLDCSNDTVVTGGVDSAPSPDMDDAECMSETTATDADQSFDFSNSMVRRWTFPSEMNPVPQMSPPESGSNNSPPDGSSIMQHYSIMNEKTGATTYICHICGFSNESKFHFNSHMNTHADHKCDICDYTSRTEGRLKRHMKQFHTQPTSDDSSSGVAGAADSVNGGADGSVSSDSLVDQGSQENFQSEKEAFEVHLQSVINCQQQQQQQQNQHQQQQSQQPLLSVSPTTDVSSFTVQPSSGSGSGSGSSRPKTYRCKQCLFVASSKNDFWIHQRTHIKSDKQLACPKCPFITEYKHHLEYHLRNHFNSKPFKCTKCNYSCVNKSMLNSHMKSHSNFYQYRCADCTYATKYCHSLKLHLRKYGHNAATVINPDGTAASTVAIDVFGNRRGPRQKRGSAGSDTASTVPTMAPAVSATGTPLETSHLEAAGMGGLVNATLMKVFQNNMLAQAVAVSQQQHQQKDQLAAAMAATGSTPRMMAPLTGYLPPLQGSASMSPSMVQKCHWCDHVATSRDSLAKHMQGHKETLHMMNYLSAGSAFPSEGDSSRSNGSSSSTADPAVFDFMSVLAGQEALAASLNGNAPSASLWSLDQKPPSDSDTQTNAVVQQPEQSPPHQQQLEIAGSSSSRRKSKAFKLDLIAMKLQCRLSDSGDSYAGSETTDGNAVDTIRRASMPETGSTAQENEDESDSKITGRPRAATMSMMQRLQSQRQSSSYAKNTTPEIMSFDQSDMKSEIIRLGQTTTDWSNSFVCNYCLIAFKDCVMYNIHMGYHAFNDPFKCNMCVLTTHMYFNYSLCDPVREIAVMDVWPCDFSLPELNHELVERDAKQQLTKLMLHR